MSNQLTRADARCVEDAFLLGEYWSNDPTPHRLRDANGKLWTDPRVAAQISIHLKIIVTKANIRSARIALGYIAPAREEVKPEPAGDNLAMHEIVANLLRRVQVLEDLYGVPLP